MQPKFWLPPRGQAQPDDRGSQEALVGKGVRGSPVFVEMVARAIPRIAEAAMLALPLSRRLAARVLAALPSRSRNQPLQLPLYIRDEDAKQLEL
jgi:hypothetical protein